MPRTPLAETLMSQNPLWAIFHVVEIWLANRYGALRSDWLNSPMLKTPLGEIPMSKNPFWAKSPCLKALSERFPTYSESDWLITMQPWDLIGWIPRCSKPHWAKSPCLKTLSERFPTYSESDWLITIEPWNLIGWILQWLKPHWVNSSCSVTYVSTIFKPANTLVNDFTKIDVLLTPMQTHTHTNKLFFFIWPSLQSREQTYLCEIEWILFILLDLTKEKWDARERMRILLVLSLLPLL